MHTNISKSMVILSLLFLSVIIAGCGGGGGGGSSDAQPSPTFTPISDYYNLVTVNSDRSIRCGVASNNELVGDYEVAPPNQKNVPMDPFPYNVKVEKYFYGIQVNHASGVSTHTLNNPISIRRCKDFSIGSAPDDARGLYTFVNNGDFNTINNQFEYPKEIRIESPSEGEQIEAGRSFKVKWSSDESEYRYFILVEYAELTFDHKISIAWSNDDFRSLNWADPNSIYSFMVGRTITDREIYVPAAIFTNQGAVNITVYGFLPEKFSWDSSSKVGWEVFAMGRKTIRVNMVP